MHVSLREVFYFPPTIHIWKAIPYLPHGDASNRGYMLPEGMPYVPVGIKETKKKKMIILIELT